MSQHAPKHAELEYLRQQRHAQFATSHLVLAVDIQFAAVVKKTHDSPNCKDLIANAPSGYLVSP